MRRLRIAIAFAFLPCSALTATQLGAQGGPLAAGAAAKPTIVVPVWTTVPLALTRPVLAKSARAGDGVFAETMFPVAVHDQMAIPAGTFVEGQIDALARPAWHSPHAHFQIHFTKLIFVSGYTVPLVDNPAGNPAASTQDVSSEANPSDLASAVDDVFPAVANAFVEATSANDVLLDNGSQIEMIFQRPLPLDASKVAAAVRDAASASIPRFQSATMCRPVPPTEGTPDTVIPGTPGTPGTPDIVIPGAPGMPDTVIPGTPATPGTPPTVISGSPGSPGWSCPGPPVSIPDPEMQTYAQPFEISAPVQLAGKSLPPGAYQASWKGLGTTATVNVIQNKKTAATANARVVFLAGKTPSTLAGTRTNPDGSMSLRSLRFAGQTFALYFPRGAP